MCGGRVPCAVPRFKPRSHTLRHSDTPTPPDTSTPPDTPTLRHSDTLDTLDTVQGGPLSRIPDTGRHCSDTARHGSTPRHQCQPTLPRHCPDTALTLPRHCSTLPRHCSTLRHSDTAGLNNIAVLLDCSKSSRRARGGSQRSIVRGITTYLLTYFFVSSK